MDLALSETQQLLKDTARAFLANECAWPAIAEVEATEDGFDRNTWARMAGLGWLGLAVPEQFGGSAGSLGDVAILLEEIGRAGLQNPFTSTWLGALALSWVASEELRSEMLPQVVKGNLILSLAGLEASGRWAEEDMRLTAHSAGDDFELNGEKRFVRFGAAADFLVVPCLGPDGSSVLLVDARDPGITVHDMRSVGGDRQCVITFENARVPASRLLGASGQGWQLIDKLVHFGTVAECAELTGVADRVLEMSVEYAKGRVQFGKPIGSFQAIQHKCADMVTDVDGCRLITQFAAWKLDSGLEADIEVSRAKTWVSDAVRRVVREGQQIHAGIGFILEHPLHRYFRRAKTGELMWGGALEHRRRVGQHVAGR